MVSGIGVAAFHPRGPAGKSGGRKRKAMAMSIFGVGGTLGFAIGPGLITAALLAWGMKGTAILALPPACWPPRWPGILTGLPIDQSGRSRPKRRIPGGARDAWGPFARLTAVVVARAVLFYGFNTFVPLYWIHVLGQSKAAAPPLSRSSRWPACAGTFSAADWRTVLGPRGSPLGILRAPAAGAGPHLASSAPVALAILVLIGCALSTSYSPMIILGQAYLPNHIGLSSGVTLGVASASAALPHPPRPHGGSLWPLGHPRRADFVPPVSAGLALTLPARPCRYRSDPAHIIRERSSRTMWAK